MTRDALDYIKRNLITETVIKHRGRAEATRVENCPYEAIEEAVVNAVYHRGYDTREPIEVRIERDELFVLSYPGPDRSVRLEQLRAGRVRPRRYRNRRIGEFLKELEFTEGRSTGIPKIMEAMEKNGSPPAEFEFDEDYSYFMVRLPVHPAALEVAESQTGGRSARSRSESTPPVTPPVTQPVDRLLKILSSGQAMSSSEIRACLALKDKTHVRHVYIDPAKSAGLIEYSIPDHPNSRLQKYRLTDKGKALLATMVGGQP